MKRALLLLVAGLVLGGCSRNNIESVPGPVYLVAVENPLAHDLDIFYDDGAEVVELGTVAAGATREFVIARPESPAVEILGRDADRTHTVSQRVELVEGSSVRVRLTP